MENYIKKLKNDYRIKMILYFFSICFVFNLRNILVYGYTYRNLIFQFAVLFAQVGISFLNINTKKNKIAYLTAIAGTLTAWVIYFVIKHSHTKEIAHYNTADTVYIFVFGLLYIIVDIVAKTIFCDGKQDYIVWGCFGIDKEKLLILPSVISFYFLLFYYDKSFDSSYKLSLLIPSLLILGINLLNFRDIEGFLISKFFGIGSYVFLLMSIFFTGFSPMYTENPNDYFFGIIYVFTVFVSILYLLNLYSKEYFESEEKNKRVENFDGEIKDKENLLENFSASYRNIIYFSFTLIGIGLAVSFSLRFVIFEETALKIIKITDTLATISVVWILFSKFNQRKSIEIAKKAVIFSGIIYFVAVYIYQTLALTLKLGASEVSTSYPFSIFLILIYIIGVFRNKFFAPEDIVDERLIRKRNLTALIPFVILYTPIIIRKVFHYRGTASLLPPFVIPLYFLSVVEFWVIVTILIMFLAKHIYTMRKEGKWDYKFLALYILCSCIIIVGSYFFHKNIVPMFYA